MRALSVPTVAVLSLMLGCSGSNVRSGSVSEPDAAPVATTAAPASVGAQTAPVASGSLADVTLWVEGFGCPMCATNLEYELEEIAGVLDATIDLERGTASVLLAKGASPSEADYRKAVDDSGLTLNKIVRGGAGR